MEKKIYPAAKAEQTEEVRNIMSDEQRDMIKSDAILPVANDPVGIEFSGITDNANLPLPTTSLEPLEDRVIIFPDKPESKTAKGIIVPDSVQEKNQPNRGRVVAAGPGLRSRYTGELQAMTIKRGDVVMYGKYAGTNIEDPSTKTKLLVMRLSDIFIRDNR